MSLLYYILDKYYFERSDYTHSPTELNLYHYHLHNKDMSGIENTPYWCQSSDVGNQQNFGVVSAFLMLLLVFSFISVFRLYKLVKLKASWDVVVIHSLLILSLVITFVEYSFSVVNYLLILDMDNNGVVYSNYPIHVKHGFPKVIASLDMLIGPSLLTILLVVPYYWVKNILYFMERVAELNPDRWIIVVNKAIMVYLIISRICYLGISIMVYFRDVDFFFEFYSQYRYFIVFDSFLSIFVVWFGGRILINNYVKLAIVEEKDKKAMHLHFRLLMMVCLFRVILNMVYIVTSRFDHFGVFKRSYRTQCLQNPTTGQPCLLAYGFFTCQIVPSGVILWMYMRGDGVLQTSNNKSLISSSAVEDNRDSFLE